MLEHKTCNSCYQSKPLTDFYVHARGNIYIDCKKCIVRRSSRWKKDNPEKYKEMSLKYINNEEKFVWYALKRPFKPSSIKPNKTRTGFQKKGWDPEITIQEMYEELILHIQLMKDKFPETDGRICRYCEKPWTYLRTGNGGKVVLSNFSVDRFDSSQTYKKGNVVFCCNGCNSIKSNSLKKHWLKFLEIDKEIHNHNMIGEPK